VETSAFDQRRKQARHKTKWAIEDEREDLINRLLEEFTQSGVALNDAHIARHHGTHQRRAVIVPPGQSLDVDEGSHATAADRAAP
jgi:hypothetical protein